MVNAERNTGPSISATTESEISITHLWNLILCASCWNSHKEGTTFTLLERVILGWNKNYHKVKFSFEIETPLPPALEAACHPQQPCWSQFHSYHGGRKRLSSFALQPTNSISKSGGLGIDLSLLAVCLYTMFTYDNEVSEKDVWSWFISNYQCLRPLQSSL